MWQGSLVCVLLALRYTVGDDPPPIAHTKLGNISGSWSISRSGRKFAAFQTIPYAKPPLGELRFQTPKELEGKWNGTYSASIGTPMCMQASNPAQLLNNSTTIFGQEDCLYLSVYTHSLEPNASIPVLVHFHGGAFVGGSNGGFSPAFLMDKDIVIVLVQYRLAVFGFLSLEEDIAPGNQGMKDQVLSLRWVRENIAAFGGDANRVTIIGESAGGASVSHHTISPLSKGLFHGAISESGTSYVTWAVAIPGEMRTNALNVFKQLKCPEDPKEGLSCAKNKTAGELFMAWMQFGNKAIPVLEKQSADAFLVGPINKWEHAKVPLLLGMTSGEGNFVPLLHMTSDNDIKNFSDNFQQLAPSLLGVDRSSTTPLEVTRKLRNFYNLDKNLTKNDLGNMTHMFTDAYFSIGVIDAANNHAGDTYMYYFDYMLKNLIPFIDEHPELGAVHVAEVPFLWGDSNAVKEEKDLLLSKNLVNIVSNFVQHGKPILDGSSWTWDKWTKDQKAYVKVDNGSFHKGTGLLEDRYNFWKTLNYRDKYNENSSGLRNFSSPILLFFVFLIYHLL